MDMRSISGGIIREMSRTGVSRRISMSDTEKLNKFNNLPKLPKQVFLLLVKGVKYEDIENILHITQPTIIAYQESAFKALGVNYRNYREEYSKVLGDVDPGDIGIT